MAYVVKISVSEKVLFMTGNQIQTSKDFEKQVEKRFRGKFEKTWKEVIDICKSHDKGTSSPKIFFETMYKPRR